MHTTVTLKKQPIQGTFRNFIFWFFDRLKGSKVHKHYTEIKQIQQHHEGAYTKSKRKEYLTELLQHAVKTVPYYQQLGLTIVALKHFPVVDKNTIRMGAASFCSSLYADKKTYKSTTSGSTGTPFTVHQDRDKRRRHIADVRFFWNTINHPWGSKLYYLKIWNAQNSKSVLTQKAQHIVPIDVVQLDDQKIAQLLKDLKEDDSPKSILAYASALDLIVTYLKKKPTQTFSIRLIAIVAMSEALDTATKAYLEDYFNCPVVSRYANLENGMLAQQTTVSGSDFLVNWASYHIEILAIDADQPAANGEIGRIVITDFFNSAMPLIRYDTGDLGVLQKTNYRGYTQYVLKKVEGRKTDSIYDTKGTLISSLLLSNSMWKYAELTQFQFVQTAAKAYTFFLNPTGRFLKETALVEEFKDYLGADAEITVRYVHEIPLLSSGKRKKVVNKMFERPNSIKEYHDAF